MDLFWRSMHACVAVDRACLFVLWNVQRTMKGRNILREAEKKTITVSTVVNLYTYTFLFSPRGYFIPDCSNSRSNMPTGSGITEGLELH